MVKIIDLTGQKHGRMTVLGFAECRNNLAYWLARCDCGVEKIVPGARLRSGRVQSCGCLHREAITNQLIDLTGQKFGRLSVLQFVCHKQGSSHWLARCDCGTEKIVAGNRLRSGGTKSCGCLGREMLRERATKHNGRHTRLYSIWSGMNTRCTNNNVASYANYGGRGIKICDEWQHSFAAFRDWALLNGYQSDLQLDRIDNDGPYTPLNCRWVSHKENANNTRRNRYITCPDGTRKTLARLAEETGINYHALLARLRRQPDIDYNSLIADLCKPRLVGGKTLRQIAKETGISYSTLHCRCLANPSIAYEEIIKPPKK